MMADLTVGVIGLGYFSQFHLAAWAKIPELRLVGVSDLDANRTEIAAATFDTKGFSDPKEMMARTAPDIVDLVVPPQAQAGLIRQVLAPGRVILCQKPFCTSLAEAEQIIREATDAGTQIVIHENFRFQPWYRDVQSFLSGGLMGQVYQCRFDLRPGDGRGPRAYLDRQPVFQTMPRLLVHETGVHFIDLFRWLFGDITSVYADLRRLNPVIAGEDAGVLLLSHRSGVQTVFDGNRLADHVASNPRLTMGEMRIEGEGGTLLLTGDGGLRFRPFGQTDSDPVTPRTAFDATVFGGGCVAALIGHLVGAIRAGTEPENTAPAYLDVIRACEAAYLSQSEGRRVTVQP